MPVSKHRRHGATRARSREPSPGTSPPNVTTIDELRLVAADPALDFSQKVTIAGVWWFEQLLGRIGDHWRGDRASRKDRKTAALLLCVAMDGEQGTNDDLAPLIGNLLRPYCPATSFATAWENAKQMAPGTARAKAAKILSASRRSAG